MDTKIRKDKLPRLGTRRRALFEVLAHSYEHDHDGIAVWGDCWTTYVAYSNESSGLRPLRGSQILRAQMDVGRLLSKYAKRVGRGLYTLTGHWAEIRFPPQTLEEALRMEQNDKPSIPTLVVAAEDDVDHTTGCEWCGPMLSTTTEVQPLPDLKITSPTLDAASARIEQILDEIDVQAKRLEELYDLIYVLQGDHRLQTEQLDRIEMIVKSLKPVTGSPFR